MEEAFGQWKSLNMKNLRFNFFQIITGCICIYAKIEDLSNVGN